MQKGHFMDNSTVTNVASRFKIYERPNGFMLIEIRHRAGARLSHYSGCVELRIGNHSTSFFYNIFNLDPVKKEYSFSLFTDKERYCCFFSAIVRTYFDETTISLIYEVTETSGPWADFKDETVQLFHIIAYNGPIEGNRPRDNNGKFRDVWLFLFKNEQRKLIEKQTFIKLYDIISKTNLLLSK